MDTLFISKSGRLYKYLSFVSYKDTDWIFDSCSLVRRLIWVTLKIIALSIFVALVSYSTTLTAAVASIGVYHGMSIPNAIELINPLFGAIGVIVLFLIPVSIVCILIVGCLIYAIETVRAKKPSLVETIRTFADDSELGKVVMAKMEKICIPVQFK